MCYLEFRIPTQIFNIRIQIVFIFIQTNIKINIHIALLI